MLGITRRSGILPRGVKHAENFKLVIFHTIDDDVRKVGEDGFTRVEYTTHLAGGRPDVEEAFPLEQGHVSAFEKLQVRRIAHLALLAFPYRLFRFWFRFRAHQHGFGRRGALNARAGFNAR